VQRLRLIPQLVHRLQTEQELAPVLALAVIGQPVTVQHAVASVFHQDELQLNQLLQVTMYSRIAPPGKLADLTAREAGSMTNQNGRRRLRWLWTFLFSCTLRWLRHLEQELQQVGGGPG